MARQTVSTKTLKTSVTIKPKSSGKASSSKTTNNGTGRKRCPTCGKYM